MQEQAFKPGKGFLFLTASALFCAVFGTAAVLWYLGTFQEPKITLGDAPSYHVAYMEHVGPYDKITETVIQVKTTLEKANINTDTGFSLLIDDNDVFENERRSKVGFIIPADTIVPASLIVEDIPARPALIATYEGGAMMGSYKAYNNMKEWAKKFDYTLSMPAMEIYHPNEIMEYQLSISKNEKK